MRNCVRRQLSVGFRIWVKSRYEGALGSESAVRAIAVLGEDRGEFEVECVMTFLDITGLWPNITEYHFHNRLMCMRQMFC